MSMRETSPNMKSRQISKELEQIQTVKSLYREARRGAYAQKTRLAKAE